MHPEAASQADSAVPDRGESLALIEPLLLPEGSRHRPALSDLVLELTQRSARFHSSIPAALRSSLADLVRAMNCYYSNLIEGHNTHPVEIERALRGDYSQDRRKRDLQWEAKAHVAVQRWIDEGGLPRAEATTVAGIRDIHRRFCELLPPDLLQVDDPATGERFAVIPGELRQRDVKVGEHIAVSPGALPRFLQRYEQAYGRIGKAESLLALAAAHHRLLWLHPFLDGNGRVARLVAHAMLVALLDTGGIWSVARGLARTVQRYKALLANCDQPRRNDLDGRGHLSEEALVAFTGYFLTVCIDQVSFMESLVQPDRLRSRILAWAEGEVKRGALPVKSPLLLDAVLYRGELPRGDADQIAGTGERQARRIVAALTSAGVLASDGPRAPLRLVFPAALAGAWLPGLFPDPD